MNAKKVGTENTNKRNRQLYKNILHKKICIYFDKLHTTSSKKQLAYDKLRETQTQQLD